MLALSQRHSLLVGARRRISAVGWRELVGDFRRLADLAVVAGTGLATAAGTLGKEPLSGVTLTVVVIGCLVAAQIFGVLGIYRPDRLTLPAMDLTRTLLGWIATFICVLAILLALEALDEVPRSWLPLWFVGGACGLVASHATTFCVLGHGRVAWRLIRQIAIVGNGGDAGQLAGRLAHGGTGFRVAAFYPLDEVEPAGGMPAGALRLTSLSELERRIGTGDIDRVVLAVPPSSSAVLADLLPALRCLPVEVGWASELPNLSAPILGLDDLGGAPVLRLSERPLDGWRVILKGLEDRVLAAILLVLTSPAFLLIAGLIRVDSPGPIFYRQQRRGFSRENITILKFRSMRYELCDSFDAVEVRQATRGDARVTRVGKFLRRTSLDELPQLINVLRGEMSLVGPRPHAVAHDRYYGGLIDDYLGRHRVKPGITGWAQVNGLRGETSSLEQMRRRVELDLYYIDHWSIWLDAQILIRTLFVGFVHRRAY